MSVNESGTYLNTSNNTATQEIQIIAQTIYITDLNKLNGLHILYSAMNPATIIPIDAIVTSCAVVIGTNIWYIYILTTTKTKHIPDGIVCFARFVINLPLIGFVFGCNAKKKEGKPITNISSNMN